jgi:hypothetical protein
MTTKIYELGGIIRVNEFIEGRPHPAQAILEISFAKEPLIIHWKVGKEALEAFFKHELG